MSTPTLFPLASPPVPIRLTPQAQDRIHALIQSNNVCGVRVRLRTRGCSGLSYVMEYVDQPVETDTAIPLPSGHFLFVHRQALLFLVGTEMDYQETPTRSGFVFTNPNEKGQCGCGTSFHI